MSVKQLSALCVQELLAAVEEQGQCCFQTGAQGGWSGVYVHYRASGLFDVLLIYLFFTLFTQKSLLKLLQGNWLIDGDFLMGCFNLY